MNDCAECVVDVLYVMMTRSVFVTLELWVGLPYFPDYKPRLFFKNFRVAAYIPVRLMCGRFQKPRTIHCTLRRAWISTWSRSAHPQYSTITDWFTDCLCSRVATPPPPAMSLSLSLCLCMRGRGRLLHAPAERGKTPAAHRMSRAEHAALAPWRTPDFDPHTSHNWPTSWGTLRMSWLGIKLLHHRRLSPTLLSPCLVFSGPRQSRLAALLPIFSSRVCIQGRTYMQGNNRRGSD